MKYGIAICTLVAWLAVPCSLAMAAPRVVSLDFCSDQYVLALADRKQIMSLSIEADQSHSFYREQAKGLPKFHSTTEEVLTLSPDVVIRTWGGDTRMLRFLKRADIPVVTATYESDAAVVARNMEAFGRALGQESRSASLTKDYIERLERLAGSPRSSLVAAYVTPGGVTAGAGTFVDEIIALAGFASSAERYGLKGWQTMPLEKFVFDPPDVLIGSFYDLPGSQMSNWSLSRHARVKAMLEEIPVIYVPGRYLSCNGLFSVDAAEYIRTQAEAMELISSSERGNP